jgi:membrane-associated protease RseP (regulator of RpoE activity)
LTSLDATSSSADTTDQPEQAPAHPPRPGKPEGSSAARLGMLVGSVVLLGLLAGVSAVVVVLAIVIMIFLHELGHYLTARSAGMKCTEFFIGFGPRIWSFRRGETEYGIKAIPAGAYVKVIGMTNLEEVDPADEPRTYRQKPYWRRMSVAVAGSAMHFLIALVCLVAYFTAFGVPQTDQWEVGRLAAGDSSELSPAAEAGVQLGDVLTVVDGKPIATFDDFRDAVVARDPGDVVGVTVLRDGDPVELSVTLGELETGHAFFGVGPTYPLQRMSIGSAAVNSVQEFGTYSRLTVEAIVRIFSPSGLSNFLGLAVDTARPTEVEPGTEIPALDGQEDRVLSIYGAARLGTQMTDTGIGGLIIFLALINIFIGIFNLVPLLPLDGGHVAIATYERIRELMSRSKARYHADVSKLIPLTYVVIFVLVGVGLVALYLDIANPINLPN